MDLATVIDVVSADPDVVSAKDRDHERKDGEMEREIGDIEQAVSAIVTWYTRNDVQQETMSRARCALPQGSLWLLARMAKSEPVRLSDLAHAVGVDNSTLTPQSQRLEREGLVAREPDPTDRRAALLRVTRVGRALLSRLHVTRRSMFTELLADWSEPDLARLATMLSRLAESVESGAPALRSPQPNWNTTSPSTST